MDTSLDALVDQVIAEYLMLIKVESENWIRVNVPEDTGTLVMDHLATQRSFPAELVFGTTVDYASFVDAMMPPVNWTKKTSKYHYQSAWFAWFERNSQWFLDAARHRVMAR